MHDHDRAKNRDRTGVAGQPRRKVASDTVAASPVHAAHSGGLRPTLTVGVVLPLKLLLTAGVALAGAALTPAGPAAAAPCGTGCTRYQADITVSGWTAPTRVIPGGTHTVTIRVTNTGWRLGNGTTQPMPGLGPDSGPVWVSVKPSSVDEHPLNDYNDGGPAFPCWNPSGNTLWCGEGRIPTATYGQFTIVWRAPQTPGTYSFRIFADSYNWTEYDENNNTVILTYDVG